ncbi:MAG: formylglycine-generating enzyme family protein [Limisphaerales bacterium]
MIRKCRRAIVVVGIHEVLANPSVVEALAAAKADGKATIWMPEQLRTPDVCREEKLESKSEHECVQRADAKVAHDEIFVPEGEFIRGTSANEEERLLALGSVVLPTEKPQRSILLDSFFIDKYPVTNRQFLEFMRTSGYEVEGVAHWGTWARYFSPGKELHPVVCLSFQDMLAYCDWIGRRLPSEAEWEKAARGKDGRIFPWGNELDPTKCNVMNVRPHASTKGATCPVNLFPQGASPYGCLDMVGNVWEIVQDWFDVPARSEESYYSKAPFRNPKGPSFGLAHVMRGGAFSTCIANCRCAFRICYDSSTKFDRVGFRTARDG